MVVVNGGGDYCLNKQSIFLLKDPGRGDLLSDQVIRVDDRNKQIANNNSKIRWPLLVTVKLQAYIFYYLLY